MYYSSMYVPLRHFILSKWDDMIIVYLHNQKIVLSIQVVG
jgi:hypothetical protein